MVEISFFGLNMLINGRMKMNKKITLNTLFQDAIEYDTKNMSYKDIILMDKKDIEFEISLKEEEYVSYVYQPNKTKEQLDYMNSLKQEILALKASLFLPNWNQYEETRTN